MAHNSEEQTVKPLQEKPIKPKPVLKAEKSLWFYKSTSLILITLAALIISLWALKSNLNLQKKWDQQQTNWLTQLKEFHEQQTNDKGQVETQNTELLKNQNALQIKVENLNNQIQTSMKEKLYQSQDWILLKARYYLELAQINAHWSDRYDAAISLLEQADNLLDQIVATPQLFKLRQALAKEITQLKAISTIDVVGLLSQLDALGENVNHLTLQTHKEQSVEKVDPSSTWKESFQYSLHSLKNMVSIRRDNQSIQPLISPLYESALRESIYLNLQEAQWAVLNNNQFVYSLALKQAIATLKRAFNLHSPTTETLLKQLNSLQEIKITKEEPQINLSLPLINEIIYSLPKAINNEKGDHK